MSTVEKANAVLHVETDDFRREVLESELPVLVDFYADWCGPCKALAPVLEEFARENPDAKVVKVNVDRSPELADHFQIESIPSLIAFRDGRTVARHTGMANKDLLNRMVAEKPEQLR